MAVRGTIEIKVYLHELDRFIWRIHVFAGSGHSQILYCTIESHWSYEAHQSATQAAKRQAKRLGIDVTGKESKR